MNNYTFKRATEEDILTIHNMANVAFRYTYREMLSPEQIDYMMDWMYSVSNLEKQLQEGHVFYIAMKGDEPCGYISVQEEDASDKGKLQFHLQKIYILPNEQGKGLGRILFEKAIEHIKTEAAGEPAIMVLNVNRDNKSAISFYKHFGMKILLQGDFHIGKGYYMTDYIMGLDIH